MTWVRFMHRNSGRAALVCENTSLQGKVCNKMLGRVPTMRGQEVMGGVIMRRVL